MSTIQEELDRYIKGSTDPYDIASAFMEVDDIVMSFRNDNQYKKEEFQKAADRFFSNEKIPFAYTDICGSEDIPKIVKLGIIYNEEEECIQVSTEYMLDHSKEHIKELAKIHTWMCKEKSRKAYGMYTEDREFIGIKAFPEKFDMTDTYLASFLQKDMILTIQEAGYLFIAMVDDQGCSEVDWFKGTKSGLKHLEPAQANNLFKTSPNDDMEYVKTDIGLCSDKKLAEKWADEYKQNKISESEYRKRLKAKDEFLSLCGLPKNSL